MRYALSGALDCVRRHGDQELMAQYMLVYVFIIDHSADARSALAGALDCVRRHGDQDVADAFV